MATGVLPGMNINPQNYGDAMVLFTATDQVEAVVDGAKPGPRGRLFIVEPGKPVKVPYEAGRFILDHMGYTGVVRVHETETETGVTYDIEGAKAESLAKTESEDKRRFGVYISSAVEDFVKRNKPVPQPDAAILRIIQRRGFDLKRFGIVPIGWEEPEKDARVTQLEAQLSALQKQIADMGKPSAADLDAVAADQTAAAKTQKK